MTRRSKARAASPDSAPLILLVDDFSDNREMYAEFLGVAGFRVSEAANGHDALERAFADPPALIVMDLSLPGLDGWEATRQLKQNSKTKHVPVIALTGHAHSGQDQRAFDAGCDAFLVKPCLPDRLLEEIRRMLQARR